MTQFERDSYFRSKAALLQVLERSAMPRETIAEIAAKLPDPVDLHEAAEMLQGYGVTRDALISRLGGSP